MSNKENSSNSDRNLAVQLQEVLHSDRARHTIKDPLGKELFAFKKNEFRYDSKEIQYRKENSWDLIHNAIATVSQSSDFNSQTDRNKPFMITHYRQYLKIAAILLLAVMLSLLYLQNRTQKSNLIGSANTQVEVVRLADGSEVILRPNSELYMVEESRSKQVYLLNGEAYFTVTSDPNRQFIVDTGSGTAEVLGTSFNIRAWNHETVVFLESGSLRLSTADQSDQIILEPGQVSIATQNNQISQPEYTDKEYYTSWQENVIVFNNRPVSSIIREIEHHFTIQIEVSSDIQDTLLGGSISIDNLQTTLQNLELVLGGEFVLISDDRYQYIDAE
ncbi:MAG: FecR domain-containing protein [Balneolaceae bacterium]